METKKKHGGKEVNMKNLSDSKCVDESTKNTLETMRSEFEINGFIITRKDQIQNRTGTKKVKEILGMDF